MKKLIALFIAAFLLAPYVVAKAAEDELSRIYKLMNEKKYSEALAAHQKYFKETNGTSVSAVRLSFGLSSWAELGKVYPPAHMALVQLASERKSIIYAGNADFNIFQEYTSINSYINRQDETVETFLYVEKQHPEQIEQLYPLVEDVLVAKKHYGIIKKYAGDPILEFENLRNSREHSLSFFRKKGNSYTLEQINTDFDNRYQLLLETTQKIDMHEESEELKRRYDGYMKGNLLRKYH